ncbi:MAG: protein kinase domain-containing protein [Planctomycetota bacterium]
MTINQTLNQSIGEQMRAEELSLRSTVPPSQVPGYRMERLLGQGAYGQVWIATNLNTGRTVAIKFYLHRAGVNWSLLTREVRNLVSMSGNRAIVQVLEVGWDSEPPYYVMEYLENGSLDDLIRNRGAIAVPKAVELFTGIAMGLNHSHGKGVLHCDLKPANVLLDQDMQPRIADFGQSRLYNEQTPSLGTLFFMAPEQADLNAVPDARWDVYALGAILYSMVVGTPPYRTPETVSTLDTASSLSERLKRYRDTILKSPYPRGHYKAPGIDRGLCSIIDRCIAKKPEDRFENVQQVLAALERRNINRLRTPLLVLGILGPLLLATIMGLSFWRAVSVAEADLSNDLREGALQSNYFAARSAAGTLESEISALFRLVEEEARRSAIEERFAESIDAAGIELLQSLATEQDPPPESQATLIDLPARNDLEALLARRLEWIRSRGGPAKSTKFDSLFVTDRYGTMIAAAFANEPSSAPIGENFAYRSYFSGQSRDLSPTTPRRNIQRTTASHLSVPFKSTTTNRWKIAVSTPISVKRKSLDEQGPDRVTEGLLVLTINIGDLQLLSTEDQPPGLSQEEDEAPIDENINRQFSGFAVLVDGHEGQREGTILQHPFFATWNGSEDSKSADGSELKFQIDEAMLKKLKEDGTYRYIDPVSKHPAGQAYQGQWIAAMEKVEIARKGSDEFERRQATSLLLLVQVPADSITVPISQMGQKLAKLFLYAVVALLLGIAGLWLIVSRFLRTPDQLGQMVRPRVTTQTGGSSDADATLGVE